jgi:cyclopropane fatty-acyl-phospholipid synthase-like methyltransferase
MNRPFSQACENNKHAILDVLKSELGDAKRVLEVGSGTGQHAVYFAECLPHLVWQTSDQIQHHGGINQWLEMACLPNILPPISLDVRDYNWGQLEYDAVFTANSLHIMALEPAKLFVSNVAKALKCDGRFLMYGPLNYDGQYTSASNARFDQWLAQKDPQSAIRDFEQLDVWARSSGLYLYRDVAMPANNRLLVWRKITEPSSVST